MRSLAFLSLTCFTWMVSSPTWAADGMPMPHHDHAAMAPADAPQQQPWGMAGDAKKVQRTITLRMSDSMRFTPEVIEVRTGETVRLRVLNEGKLPHELVMGTEQTLTVHAQHMREHPGMTHDEPGAAQVAPGRHGDIVWTFNRPGEFDFACLVAGHSEAGMTGRIVVH